METPPKPGPPRQASARPAEKLSILENIFGFRDPAFRAYMTAQRPTPLLLRYWGDVMAESNHGLVLYSAGWAAAELVIHRTKVRSDPDAQRRNLDERRTTLKQAKERWLRAAEVLPSLRRAQPTEKRVAQIGHVELQLAQALAHTPSMEVIAAQMCNASFDCQTREERLQKTHENSVELAKFLLSFDLSDPSEREGRIGKLSIMSGVLCGLVGQFDDNPRKYVFMPASFRRAHHKLPFVRADCLAVPLGRRFGSMGMQVRTAAKRQGGPDASGQSLVVEASRDLVIPGMTLSETLRSYVDMAEGRPKPDAEPSFAALGRVLTMQVGELSEMRRAAEANALQAAASGES
ncbi:MAG TPA: hypothetical protein VLG11_00180 [Candidatus Saccharimonadales bacterium]|nr:hypothetical protein [Candidatus Saccharimonadales bacterium]